MQSALVRSMKKITLPLAASEFNKLYNGYVLFTRGETGRDVFNRAACAMMGRAPFEIRDTVDRTGTTFSAATNAKFGRKGER